MATMTPSEALNLFRWHFEHKGGPEYQHAIAALEHELARIEATKTVEKGPALLFQRQGIIPCGRCAFFVPNGSPAPGIPSATEGTCRARIPQRSMVSSPVWPSVDGDPAHGHGCGEGLLREEAAPLPPAVRELI